MVMTTLRPHLPPEPMTHDELCAQRALSQTAPRYLKAPATSATLVGFFDRIIRDAGRDANA